MSLQLVCKLSKERVKDFHVFLSSFPSHNNQENLSSNIPPTLQSELVNHSTRPECLEGWQSVFCAFVFSRHSIEDALPNYLLNKWVGKCFTYNFIFVVVDLLVKFGLVHLHCSRCRKVCSNASKGNYLCYKALVTWSLGLCPPLTFPLQLSRYTFCSSHTAALCCFSEPVSILPPQGLWASWSFYTVRSFSRYLKLTHSMPHPSTPYLPLLFLFFIS